MWHNSIPRMIQLRSVRFCHYLSLPADLTVTRFIPKPIFVMHLFLSQAGLLPFIVMSFAGLSYVNCHIIL